MTVENVTDKSFDVDVKMSSVPVIVDFWAPWCEPCKQISPILDQISEEMQGKIKVVKINVDENPRMASQLGVRGIPAMYIYDEGEVISNLNGAKPAGAIKGWIADALA
jgi:thioredoxin 1